VYGEKVAISQGLFGLDYIHSNSIVPHDSDRFAPIGVQLPLSKFFM